MEAQLLRTDNLYPEEVQRARAMSPDEKFFAGATLFEYACDITRAGIRAQFPQLDDAGVERVLEARLLWARRLEGKS